MAAASAGKAPPAVVLRHDTRGRRLYYASDAAGRLRRVSAVAAAAAARQPDPGAASGGGAVGGGGGGGGGGGEGKGERGPAAPGGAGARLARVRRLRGPYRASLWRDAARDVEVLLLFDVHERHRTRCAPGADDATVASAPEFLGLLAADAAARAAGPLPLDVFVEAPLPAAELAAAYHGAPAPADWLQASAQALRPCFGRAGAGAAAAAADADADAAAAAAAGGGGGCPHPTLRAHGLELRQGSAAQALVERLAHAARRLLPAPAEPVPDRLPAAAAAELARLAAAALAELERGAGAGADRSRAARAARLRAALLPAAWDALLAKQVAAVPADAGGGAATRERVGLLAERLTRARLAWPRVARGLAAAGELLADAPARWAARAGAGAEVQAQGEGEGARAGAGAGAGEAQVALGAADREALDLLRLLPALRGGYVDAYAVARLMRAYRPLARSGPLAGARARRAVVLVGGAHAAVLEHALRLLGFAPRAEAGPLSPGAWAAGADWQCVDLRAFPAPLFSPLAAAAPPAPPAR